MSGGAERGTPAAGGAAPAVMIPPGVAVAVRGFSQYFGGDAFLKDLTLDVRRHEILGVIGPAGSGKSTLLGALNRMNELAPGARREGEIYLEGKAIYDPDVDVVALRRRVGMVFATPVPLPRSIEANITFGVRLAGQTPAADLPALVRECLESVALWDEVKDRLGDSALRLSGGQQQRLCIARVLALRPEVVLLDEPTSGLDPISTMKIEGSLAQLKRRYTIVLVTNNVKQAARAADRTAFLLDGSLVEEGPTDRIFTAPEDPRTDSYLRGRFG